MSTLLLSFDLWSLPSHLLFFTAEGATLSDLQVGVGQFTLSLPICVDDNADRWSQRASGAGAGEDEGEGEVEDGTRCKGGREVRGDGAGAWRRSSLSYELWSHM